MHIQQKVSPFSCFNGSYMFLYLDDGQFGEPPRKEILEGGRKNPWLCGFDLPMKINLSLYPMISHYIPIRSPVCHCISMVWQQKKTGITACFLSFSSFPTFSHEKSGQDSSFASARPGCARPPDLASGRDAHGGDAADAGVDAVGKGAGAGWSKGDYMILIYM